MNSITITLPHPDKRLNAHNKGHWRAKSAAVKQSRDDAIKLAMAAMGGYRPPLWERVAMRQDFYFPQNSRQDLVNFAQMLKAGVDGIVDSGVIADDNHLVIPDVHLHFAGYDRAKPRVEVIITPTEETA